MLFTSKGDASVIERFPRGRAGGRGSRFTQWRLATEVSEREMPKRSCPFGDSAPLQLKTRVRMRELSQGVMGERYRREIFGEETGEGE